MCLESSKQVQILGLRARCLRQTRSLAAAWADLPARRPVEAELASPRVRLLRCAALLRTLERRDYKFWLILASAAMPAMFLCSGYLPVPMLLIAACTGCHAFRTARTARRARAELQRLSGKVDDTDLIPYLLDFIAGASWGVRRRIRIVAPFLRRLLPQVTALDVEKWNLVQRQACLVLLATPFEDLDVTAHLLRVTTLFDDELSLQRLRRLIDSMTLYAAVPAAGRTLRRRTEATAILEQAVLSEAQLALKIHGSIEAATLLRGCDGRVGQQHELLRPCRACLTDDPNVLLRLVVAADGAESGRQETQRV